jgi:hypothetical protein
MVHSSETRKVLRELGKELDRASRVSGEKLLWTASDQLVLNQISSILDREAQLFSLYESAEEVDVRIRLSAELRLLEQAAARLVKLVRTDLPGPESLRTIKARRAANMRWGHATG